VTTAYPTECLATRQPAEPQPRAQPRVQRAPLLLALLAVTAGTALIGRTYSVFSQTYDEPAHLACGTEWLDRGTYNLEAMHPPLARVAIAILPYVAGARSQGFPYLWTEGNAILEHNGHYWRTLTLARLGILPFFWLTCFLVWRYMARAFSGWHAAIAVWLLAFCPVVLAHASVATTDAPLMALFLASLLALEALLQHPKWSTALAAGVVIALASLTKFSEMPFLACSGAILLLYHWVSEKRFPVPWRDLLLTLAAFALTIWAGYRFSLGPIVNPGDLAPEQQAKFARLPSWEKKLLVVPYMPAEEFFRGLKVNRYQGIAGRRGSYLLGEVYDGGRWYFFPVALLVKTPIPLLLLSLSGAAWLLIKRSGLWDRRTVFLIAGVVGPLTVGMAGSMNLGLRHVLPVYPFLAMLAAVAAVELWKLQVAPALGTTLRVLVVLLLAWSVVTCLRPAPDFLAYFNEPAQPYASRILVESDLDWGQDLERLSQRLDALHVHSVWLCYFGVADFSKRLAQTAHELKPGDRPTGWVAISEARLRKRPNEYGWLAVYPYERVGSSIRLYHFASPPNA